MISDGAADAERRDDIVCVETHGKQHSGPETTTYVKDPSDTKGALVVQQQGGYGHGLSFQVQGALVDAFLPIGYPGSVSRDYFDYQVWDTAQAFCSYITGTLANQAVLRGVGVGDENATAVGATITYLMRDVTGMIGRILFAWARGSDLDNNAKRWRLIADVLNDLALMLDLLAPWFPRFFVLFVCCASLTRAVVGVAGGATRAALTMHQARSNNMGDVSAKDGSQETLVNLTGVVVGMVLLPLIDENVAYTWLLFTIATVCHMYFNYRAVTCLILEEFNTERLRIAVQHYVNDGSVPTPTEMGSMEPVFPWYRSFTLTVGDTFGETFRCTSELRLAQVASRFSPGSRHYLLSYQPNSDTQPTSLHIKGVLHNDADMSDVLRAHFHALVVGHVFESVWTGGEQSVRLLQPERSGHLGALVKHVARLCGDEPPAGQVWGQIMKESASYVEANYQNFIDVCVAAGWRIDRAQLTVGRYRCQWSELDLT
eukprot:m.42159 g.42159  ORF g.42159 m.42159 type:complete len:486 (+) comp6234_c0_seq1:2383-3840(+)